MPTDLAITYHPPAALKPAPRNARTHSRKQVRQIADSIATFGFTNPLLIDEKQQILAGHGRLEAAKLLGLNAVPCVCLSHMTVAQKRAYLLADNKLALNAGWDEELLALELQELLTLDPAFSLEVTGFSIAEIDSLIEGLDVEEPDDPKDEVLPPLRAGPAITVPGDLWLLGPHRLLCGNALSADDCSKLMGGEQAQMVFTDPPYNVPIEGHVSGLGATRHREFAMASGEMSREAFTQFLTTTMQNLAACSSDGAIHFICMDWRHMQEMLAAGEQVYGELKNLIVWAKDNGGMGTFYRSRHELIFAYKYGSASHINSFELGQHGRYRTNVWAYKGMNSFGRGRDEEIQLHPTVKPVSLIADAIKDVSRRKGIVLDLFGGSGSTLIGAHKTGRRAFLCELDPLYCDRIIERWQQHAGDDAINAASGESFRDRQKNSQTPVNDSEAPPSSAGIAPRDRRRAAVAKA